jgi:hypothetical protein
VNKREAKRHRRNRRKGKKANCLQAEEFEQAKKKALGKLDQFIHHAQDGSKTGPSDGTALDLPLVPFLKEINQLRPIYTMNSCMGHDDPKLWDSPDGERVGQHPDPFLEIKVLPSMIVKVAEALSKEFLGRVNGGSVEHNGQVALVEPGRCGPAIIISVQSSDYKDMFGRVVKILKDVTQ